MQEENNTHGFRRVQKSFSNSYDEATDTNQETRTTRLEGNFNSSSEENIHSSANNWRLSNAPHWSSDKDKNINNLNIFNQTPMDEINTLKEASSLELCDETISEESLTNHI